MEDKLYIVIWEDGKVLSVIERVDGELATTNTCIIETLDRARTALVSLGIDTTVLDNHRE